MEARLQTFSLLMPEPRHGLDLIEGWGTVEIPDSQVDIQTPRDMCRHVCVCEGVKTLSVNHD